LLTLRHLPGVQIDLSKIHVPEIRFSDIKVKAEEYLIITAILSVTVVILSCAIHGLASNSKPTSGVIHVKVRQGDTLWTYAQEYGNPDTYILKRVHKIAQMNGLDPSKPLKPGQDLIIPCEKKTICASVPVKSPKKL